MELLIWATNAHINKSWDGAGDLFIWQSAPSWTMEYEKDVFFNVIINYIEKESCKNMKDAFLLS